MPVTALANRPVRADNGRSVQSSGAVLDASLLAVSGVLDVLGWLGMPPLIVGAILRHKENEPRLGDGLFHLGLVGLACFTMGEVLTALVTGQILGLQSPIRRPIERMRSPWEFWITFAIFAVFAVSLMSYSAMRVVRLVYPERPAMRADHDVIE